MLVLVGEQGAAFGQFHDHVHLAVLDERVPQLADVRVVDRRMQVDLSLQQQALVLCYFLSDVDLDGKRGTILTA